MVGTSQKILIVDDEPDTCANLSDILTDLGYVVDTAPDGFAALELIQHKTYDIALLDMQMPVMDGSEAITVIRASEKNGDRVPIVALTADLIGEHQKSFLAAGADIVVRVCAQSGLESVCFAARQVAWQGADILVPSLRRLNRLNTCF